MLVTRNSAEPVEAMHTLQSLSQIPRVQSGLNSSTKLKLQLFPIDDNTRRALESDNHNPHLELTLSTRKKISSVLEHLNRKWGNSNVASGELMIFPYGAQKETLASCLRWAQDSVASALDVHTIVGSPQVFRLRYGWFSNAEHGIATSHEQGLMASLCETGERNPNTEKEAESFSATHASLSSPDYQPRNVISVNKNRTCTSTENSFPNKRICSSVGFIDNVSETMIDNSTRSNGVGDTGITRNLGDKDETRSSHGNALSAGEWADSLTNISVGDLLSGVSQTEQPNTGISVHLQDFPFSCDSFDAAIAAHISKQRDKTQSQPALDSDASSIWDAEETCDGFFFQKKLVESQTNKQAAMPSLPESYHLDEDLSDRDGPTENFAQEEPMDDCTPDPNLHDDQAKGFSELADIYWPESLGPLDLDIPCSKYHSEDIILSDSLGGLNRLIASSLDAFQNCSFFGSDKKESPATVETRQIASFSNFKIETGL